MAALPAETAVEQVQAAPHATNGASPGLSFDQLLAAAPVARYRLEPTMQAILRSELERGRVAFDGVVYRINPAAWPADLLEAIQRLALPD